MRSHSIFAQYKTKTAEVSDAFDADPYGGVIRRSFVAASIRPDGKPRDWGPQLDEVYFEWIDLMEAIALADTEFTMVELGAGFGRWSVHAAVLMRNHRAIPIRLVAVEPEPGHFEMMRQHFIDNGIDPDRHSLVQAAVTSSDDPVLFTVGHSAEWYGQCILPTLDTPFGHWPEARIASVPGISLSTILRNLELVDLIDMDIQGAEADVIGAARDVLSAKVKRIHIGTHSADIERKLEEIFDDIGWTCYRNFACMSAVQTPYGLISFEDGVQTWINPALHA